MVATQPTLGENVPANIEANQLPTQETELLELLDTTITIKQEGEEILITADGVDAEALKSDDANEFISFIDKKLPEGMLEDGIVIKIKDGEIAVTDSNGEVLQTMEAANDPDDQMIEEAKVNIENGGGGGGSGVGTDTKPEYSMAA